MKKFQLILFKKQKKAWVRIVEATIASLIIIGFALVIMSKQETQTPNVEEEIYEKQANILDIISKNESLRNNILNNDKNSVNNAISTRIPGSWDFSINICNLDEICNGDIPYNKDVYSTEKVITSTLTKYSPKKLKLFVWVK